MALGARGTHLDAAEAQAFAVICQKKLGALAAIVLSALVLSFRVRAQEPFLFRYALLGLIAFLIWQFPLTAMPIVFFVVGLIGLRLLWHVATLLRKPPKEPRSPVDIQRDSYFIRRLGRAISFGRTPLVIWVFLLTLPFSALPGAPFRELLGGIFRDLSLVQIGLTSLVMWLDAILLALMAGIYFDRLERRWDMLIDRWPRPENERDQQDALTFPAVVRQVSLPPKPTFLAFSLLPWIAGTLVLFGERNRGSTQTDALTLTGIIFAGLVLSGLALWALSTDRKIRVPYAEWLFDGYPEIFSKRGSVNLKDMLAIGVVVAFLFVFLVAAVWNIGSTAILPTSVIVFLGLGLLSLVFIGAEFYVSRYEASVPVLLLVALMILGLVVDADHYFSPLPKPASPASSPDSLSPEEALFTEDWGNMVLVTATGGGIAAAGWMTAAIHRLVEQRPETLGEIRVISGVSGGAVGAAFLVDALAKAPHPLDETLVSKVTYQAHEAATTESLDAMAFGLVARDFFRPVLGRWSMQDNDRGHIQERAWASNADAARKNPSPTPVECGLGQGELTINCTRSLVKQGQLPALILNSVVLETGRRIMITPIDLPSFPDLDEPERAYTFDEYFGQELTRTEDCEQKCGATSGQTGQWRLQTEHRHCMRTCEDGHVDVDLSLWSAARLSSVFPFAAPPARSDFGVSSQVEGLGAGVESLKHWGHHLIDGGYYDNYGVASLVELLSTVAKNSKWRGGRLLVLRLEAFPRTDPADEAPVGAFQAKTLGPLIASANVSKKSAAFTRNNAELHRLLERLRENTVPNAKEDWEILSVCSVTLAPTCYDGPLSWKLTGPEKFQLRLVWGLEDHASTVFNGGESKPPYPPLFNGQCRLEDDREALQAKIEAIVRYLGPERGPCPGHEGLNESAAHFGP